MENLLDLFLHELRDAYDAEQRGVETLKKMEGHVTDESLKDALASHREETETHVERIEQVFRMLGEDAEAETCPGFRGIAEEHARFMKEDPSEEISNIFHVWAAVKAERYEISSYEALIELADRMGNADVADVLEETLAEEEQALERLLELAADVKVEKAAAR